MARWKIIDPPNPSNTFKGQSKGQLYFLSNGPSAFLLQSWEPLASLYKPKSLPRFPSFSIKAFICGFVLCVALALTSVISEINSHVYPIPSWPVFHKETSPQFQDYISSFFPFNLDLETAFPVGSLLAPPCPFGAFCLTHVLVSRPST